MKEEDGVLDIHDMHVWTLGSEIYALSCHVMVDDVKISESSRILADLKRDAGARLRHRPFDAGTGISATVMLAGLIAT